MRTSDFRMHLIGTPPPMRSTRGTAGAGPRVDWDAVVPAASRLVAEGELPAMVLVAYRGPPGPTAAAGTSTRSTPGGPRGVRSRPR